MRRVALLVVLFFSVSCFARQLEPDRKRVIEIQAALVSHGFTQRAPSGKWDVETKETLRGIANSHGWQINRVPDARVLILLGLGNKYSNLYVTRQPGQCFGESQKGCVKERK